jgi:hypothetical protein
MAKRRRRFEVLLPHQYNDGRLVPEELLGKAYREILDYFGAVGYEKQRISGYWRYKGRIYHEKYARIVVDVRDTASNRRWIREFKSRWKEKLEQIELWIVSYRVEVE